MPKQYEAIRDSFIKKGMSSKAAKTKAAKIYNSKHKKNPVGPSSDRRAKRVTRTSDKKKAKKKK